MTTFKEHHEFLQTFEEESIFGWLSEKWEGKDKQETLLRHFGGLGLIDKLNKYNICKGSFNLKTIEEMSSIKDIFYDNLNNLIKVKDKGDSSDLTCIDKNDEKHLLVISSKNLNKMNVGKLDIDKLLTNSQQYIQDGYKISYGFCVRNREEFEIMKSNVEETSRETSSILEREDTVVIDWEDLNQSYKMFKSYFTNRNLEDILGSNKKPLSLKMHQQFGVLKTLEMKNNNADRILWGHIQRSGKSYIIAGTIIEDSKDKDTM